jgi:hypothetical protein
MSIKCCNATVEGLAFVASKILQVELLNRYTEILSKLYLMME